MQIALLLLWAWTGLLYANGVSKVAQVLSPASLYLLESAYAGSIKGVKQALADDADIHAQASFKYLRDTDYHGDLYFEYDRSAVVLAAYNGHEEIVEFLLDKGANPNDIRGGIENNVLHLGVGKSSVKIVHLALEYGVDPNAIGSPPDPALTQAAWEGVFTGSLTEFGVRGKQVKIMRLLVEYGADPNLGGMDGRTPLTVSAYGGFTQAVKFLLANGADVNISLTNGDTPLHEAADNQAGLKTIKLLLKAGAKINAVNRDGNTALHLAVRQEDASPRTVRYLLNNDADGNAKNNDGHTPLDLARLALQLWQETADNGYVVGLFIPYSVVNRRIKRHQAIVKMLEQWQHSNQPSDI